MRLPLEMRRHEFRSPFKRSLTWSLICVGSLFATQAMAIDVANQTDWNTAVAAVAVAGAGTTVSINFTGGFTLASSLATLQAGSANVTVNITGNNQTIDGAATFQGIQVSGVNAPTVNISSLVLTNTAARGGNGENGQNGFYSAGLSYGSGGGGGGALGAGGGLFVGSGANVTLAAVTFTGSTATGGTGGNGGVAQNAAADPVNGGNGGAGGVLNNSGVAGGGGAGGTGGNTGTQGTAGAAGTSIGDGGGGGGGSGTTNSNSYTSNNPGGNGNAGGGNGRPGGDGVTNNNGSQGPGADGGSGGNGGSAQGGAVYVATGGTLTILDSPITGATVTGGTGGSNGVGQGPSSINGSPGAAGGAQGAGIFLSGVTANIGVTSGTLVYGNTIGGTGLVTGGINTAINKTGPGMLVLSATNTFIGNVNISGGTLSVASQANLSSSGKNVVMSDGTTFAVSATATFNNSLGYSIAGASSFDIAAGTTTTAQGVVANNGVAGTLVKTNTGTLILSGANTYTGGTTINGGVLQVGAAGALPSTGTVSVAAGATLNLNGFNQTFSVLTGAGSVTGANSTVTNTFAPGNGSAGSTMAITGNLAFQSGAQYVVQVDPASASRANVTGTATLTGASATAVFAGGTYAAKQYTILNATGGVTGTFGGLTNTGLPAGFSAALGYDANNAYLNLTLNLAPTQPLNANQQAVANALTGYFNRNGGIPLVFGTLTPPGLTQVSGETATGSQQTTFDAMNAFLGLITDPFAAGRGDTTSPAIGYADEALAYAGKRPPSDALAAIYRKAPPMLARPEERWNVWAAGFGGSRSTDGNAVVGSGNTTSSIAGGAVGADYWFSRDTVAGFALAGGGTSFSVAGSGSGRSDLFQAGAFVRHNIGPAYISAALAYGWQDVTTDRTVTAAGTDILRARFNANAYSGRLEGGYRFVVPTFGGIGLTPYAAGQFTTFDLPSYTENLVAGANNFGLSYAARSVTDSRSELGLRSDKSFAVTGGMLTLRGRVAWAHDFNTDRAISATFQTLPGASFTVNGAAQAADAALVTAAAEMKWMNGWSAAATFEGEFSNVTRSYAGKSLVRYAW